MVSIMSAMAPLSEEQPALMIQYPSILTCSLMIHKAAFCLKQTKPITHCDCDPYGDNVVNPPPNLMVLEEYSGSLGFNSQRLPRGAQCVLFPASALSRCRKGAGKKRLRRPSLMTDSVRSTYDFHITLISAESDLVQLMRPADPLSNPRVPQPDSLLSSPSAPSSHPSPPLHTASV